MEIVTNSVTFAEDEKFTHCFFLVSHDHEGKKTGDIDFSDGREVYKSVWEYDITLDKKKFMDVLASNDVFVSFDSIIVEVSDECDLFLGTKEKKVEMVRLRSNRPTKFNPEATFSKEFHDIFDHEYIRLQFDSVLPAEYHIKLVLKINGISKGRKVYKNLKTTNDQVVNYIKQFCDINTRCELVTTRKFICPSDDLNTKAYVSQLTCYISGEKFNGKEYAAAWTNKTCAYTDLNKNSNSREDMWLSPFSAASEVFTENAVVVYIEKLHVAGKENCHAIPKLNFLTLDEFSDLNLMKNKCMRVFNISEIKDKEFCGFHMEIEEVELKNWDKNATRLYILKKETGKMVVENIKKYRFGFNPDNIDEWKDFLSFVNLIKTFEDTTYFVGIVFASMYTDVVEALSAIDMFAKYSTLPKESRCYVGTPVVVNRKLDRTTYGDECFITPVMFGKGGNWIERRIMHDNCQMRPFMKKMLSKISKTSDKSYSLSTVIEQIKDTQILREESSACESYVFDHNDFEERHAFLKKLEPRECYESEDDSGPLLTGSICVDNDSKPRIFKLTENLNVFTKVDRFESDDETISEKEYHKNICSDEETKTKAENVELPEDSEEVEEPKEDKVNEVEEPKEDKAEEVEEPKEDKAEEVEEDSKEDNKSESEEESEEEEKIDETSKEQVKEDDKVEESDNEEETFEEAKEKQEEKVKEISPEKEKVEEIPDEPEKVDEIPPEKEKVDEIPAKDEDELDGDPEKNKEIPEGKKHSITVLSKVDKQTLTDEPKKAKVKKHRKKDKTTE